MYCSYLLVMLLRVLVWWLCCYFVLRYFIGYLIFVAGWIVMFMKGRVPCDGLVMVDYRFRLCCVGS